MKSRFAVAAILFAPVLAFACPPTECRDRQIVAEVHAANLGEVLVAQSVLGRLQTPSVIQFARDMIAEHTAADQTLMEVAQRNGLTPVESELSRTLTAHAQEEVEMLRPLAGIELDRAYIDGQIQDHQLVLNTLQSRWIPEATNPELKALLEGLQAPIANHLARATEIRRQLGLMEAAF